jgi:hypothetical protein
VSVLGLEAAWTHARELRRVAQAALDRGGLAETERLRALADRVVDRES